MTTTNKNHLTLVDEESMQTPAPGNFTVGYVNGALVQKDDAGGVAKILTDATVAAAVLGTELAGLDVTGTTPVTADDTVLEGFGKLQGQANGFVPNTRQVNGKALSADVTLTTDDVSEGTTNLYNVRADMAETAASNPSFVQNKDAILDLPLTGLATDDATPITEEDTVLEGFGKLQGQADQAVPNTRTVNGKALTSNVTLTTDDVFEGTTNLYHVQSDFAETDSNEPAFIKNKPTVQDGHTILNPSGTAMNQRAKLQFQGEGIESVTDDASNNITIITIPGGDEPGMANPMNALGDIITGVDASGSPGKLSMGSADQVLTVNSDLSGLAWRTPELISTKNYWPANGTFGFSSYVRKPYCVDGDYVTAVDGWLIYQSAPADQTYPTYFYAVPALTVDTGYNDLCFERTNGNVTTIDGSHSYRIARIFSWRETAPLRGQTVTFSFGLKFGTNFPKGSNGGLYVVMYGCTASDGQKNAAMTGVFSSGNITIMGDQKITTAPTDTFERKSFTVNIPANAYQISIRFQHYPVGNGTSVGADYKFYIRRPALRIGTDSTEPELPTQIEDFWSNCRRFQRILVTYSGTATSGDAIVQRVPFPIPMESAGTPICMRGYDEVAPVGFPAAARSDASSITTNDFVITRVAGTTGSVSFRTWYSIGCPLWPFNDNIPNY